MLQSKGWLECPKVLYKLSSEPIANQARDNTSSLLAIKCLKTKLFTLIPRLGWYESF
jgi:hypothetical protein